MKTINYPDKKVICGNCRHFFEGWDRKYGSCYTFTSSRSSTDAYDFPCEHYDDEKISEVCNRSFSHL